jgi:acetyltransferase-like isoleucine patch superfamily enzyme
MSMWPYAVGHLVWRGVRHAVRLMRRRRFGACGAHAHFDPFGSYLPPEKMFFGAGIFIGPGARVSAREGFYVGDAATIGPELCVMGGDHNMRVVGSPLSKVLCGGVNLPVRVGPGAWLGARVTLLKGVSVGEGSVVGAGSVVTKDVPAYAVAVGNPCSPVHARFGPEELAEHLWQTASPLRPHNVIAGWRKAGL